MSSWLGGRLGATVTLWRTLEDSAVAIPVALRLDWQGGTPTSSFQWSLVPLRTPDWPPNSPFSSPVSRLMVKFPTYDPE